MSRYAKAHADPKGPGDARPTALQVVKDEQMEGKLKGKVIVITGTSSGLGVETARALAATGATLYLTARNLDKARDALQGMFEPSRMELVQMDLESFDSVRAAARTILSKTDAVNILINNAGCMAVPEVQLTREGHELQFGANHLAHFLFFQLLKPALLSSSTPEFQSRVVALSSSAHAMSGINDSDNYDYQKGGYTPWAGYGQSKTANIYMANEIERRYGARGLHATSVHPGGAMSNLGRHLSEKQVEDMKTNPLLINYFQNLEQGAATTVWAAISKEMEGTGGKYLLECTVSEGISAPDDPYGSGHAAHAYDPESEARLWSDSLKLTGFEE